LIISAVVKFPDGILHLTGTTVVADGTATISVLSVVVAGVVVVVVAAGVAVLVLVI
jgi:hypothetical protein